MWVYRNVIPFNFRKEHRHNCFCRSRCFCCNQLKQLFSISQMRYKKWISALMRCWLERTTVSVVVYVIMILLWSYSSTRWEIVRQMVASKPSVIHNYAISFIWKHSSWDLHSSDRTSSVLLLSLSTSLVFYIRPAILWLNFRFDELGIGADNGFGGS